MTRSEATGEAPLSACPLAPMSEEERRSLTKSQRAAIAAEMIPTLEAEGPSRAWAGKAARMAGRLVGVGATAVENAKRVQKLDAELFEQVKRGAIGVEAAYRKVKSYAPQEAAARLPKEARARQIRELAADGHRAGQISAKLGIGEQQVRNLARDDGITLPDAAIGRVHPINVHRVIESTVHGLEGFALGLQTINGAAHTIDAATAAQWSESLRASLIPIHRLQKHLRRGGT
jgi:hypothetical protein